MVPGREGRLRFGDKGQTNLRLPPDTSTCQLCDLSSTLTLEPDFAGLNLDSASG